jgi:acetaldehyde dehydrogenase (acetylating)
VYGTSFDHGTICSSEQAIVAEESIRDQVIAELKKNGAYFLQPDEIGKLGREMVNLEAHTINPKYVGKSAKRIAELAGMSVPENTRVLIAQLEGVGRDYPLSAEKLSPVLALYFGKDRSACMDLCASLLRFGGLGHTCAIHATDEQVIREYGLRMPAFRVVVNSPAPQGSIGSSTNLFPAMTLGSGKEVVASLAPSQPVPDRAQPSAVACACTHEPVDASVDRVAVARAVERFVSRRTPAATAPVPQPQPAGATTVPGTHAPKPRPVDFVSEVEIRQALRRREKIIVGRKTIITPAARDLAAEYDVLVVAD